MLPNRIGKLSVAQQWLLLAAGSAALGLLLTWLRFPAAFLLGPMLGGIALAAAGGTVRIPMPVFVGAQGIIGCLIAKVMPLAIAGEVLRHWPILVFGVLSVIAASALLGWLLTRMRVLPGTAVLWGSSPGGATAIVLMAEAYGADGRLVAFMQYLRVVLVAAAASAVARIWGGAAPHLAGTVTRLPEITWFPRIVWLPFSETLALAAAGPVLASVLRIPAGAFLLPLIAGIALTHSGWMTIELPPWLLAISYALIGWTIGLRFTYPLLVHVARALPRVFACTLALITLCGVLAGLLVIIAGIDPLTAYLATSPGGADSVAIIATSSNVDVPFVMAMQTTRLVAVLVLVPALARFLGGRSAAATE
jgi:membrane AbrB-like protein